MFYAKIVLFIGLVACIFWLVLVGASDAQAQKLPKRLPKATCSTLNHLKGKKLYKHYLWHLCKQNRSKYRIISRIIWRESRWQPKAKNPYSSAAGLAQFLSSWYNGKWHFNPYNPILSLRVMVYVWNRPSLGGSQNWAM